VRRGKKHDASHAPKEDFDLSPMGALVVRFSKDLLNEQTAKAVTDEDEWRSPGVSDRA